MTEVPIPPAERADRHTLVAQQARRLVKLLRDIYGRNPFYTRKLDAAGIRPGTSIRSICRATFPTCR